jgi:putative sulfotransferase
MGTPTFIVGTGRCGSTMLSNMLREHPKILSLSEFFSMVTDGGRSTKPFSPEPMEGREFWSIISAITPMPRFTLRHRIPFDEWLYPVDGANTRFSRETGVPALLLTALPHLSDEHDILFDVLAGETASWPIASISEHYHRLFRWLTDHYGKRIWVERSGASLTSAAQLLTLFPDARFVHIARDGRDAALSVQQHQAFVLGIAMLLLKQHLGVDPLESPDRTNVDLVPAELLPFLPENFDPEALRASPVSLSLCGEFWTQQVLFGVEAMKVLPTDRLITLRFEDILADPKCKLDALTAFLGEEFIDGEWSTRCAATIRQPRSTWRDLPEAEAHALTEACRPGFELLRLAGVHYDV